MTVDGDLSQVEEGEVGWPQGQALGHATPTASSAGATASRGTAKLEMDQRMEEVLAQVSAVAAEIAAHLFEGSSVM